MSKRNKKGKQDSAKILLAVALVKLMTAVIELIKSLLK